jgi:hypothetical protein
MSVATHAGPVKRSAETDEKTNSGRLYYVVGASTIGPNSQAPERVVLSGGNYVYTNVTPSEAINNSETSWFFPSNVRGAEQLEPSHYGISECVP